MRWAPTVVVVDGGTTAFAVVVGSELLLSPVQAAPTNGDDEGGQHRASTAVRSRTPHAVHR